MKPTSSGGMIEKARLESLCRGVDYSVLSCSGEKNSMPGAEQVLNIW